MPTTTVFLIIAAFLLALALAGFQYFYKAKRGGAKTVVFSALRFITLFAILVLIINPKINRTEYSLEKPNLVLAVDNSSSIEELGAGEEVRTLVNELRQDSELREKFDIETFTFGKEVNQAGAINFSEPQTDLPQVFRTFDILFRDKTAPVVLITDGNQTRGEEFNFAAGRFRQPLIPVVAGDTTTYLDLNISRVNVNKYAFLNNKFPVEVMVNYTGNSSVETQLKISSGNAVIYSKPVSFSSEKNSEVVRAELQANSVGARIYTVSVTPVEAEKNVLNNRRDFAVEVIDERSKILIAYSVLHSDLGALRKSIESNQQREVVLKHISEVSEVGEYQLVILYQPDSQFNNLISGIKSGGQNFFLITGPKTDWRFLNKVQNVFQQEITYQSEEFFPVWNENFKAFQTENIQFSKLPPLEGNFGNLDFPEGLDILLYRKIQGVQTNQPLLSIAETEGSKMAFLAGANIWRWRSAVYQETGSFQKFDDLVGKLVQFLASGSRKERLVIDYEPLYAGSEEVVIKADYFDRNYNFDQRASLELELISDGNEQRQISFLVKRNSYEVDLSSLPAGEYNFRVKVEGEPVSRSGSFRILDFDVEKQFASANLSGLKNLAAAGGGEVFFPNELTRLKKQLLSDDSYATVQKSHQKNVSLIDWEFLLGIIVLALSAEWFLRKYYGHI